jgi:hypothetical protein
MILRFPLQLDSFHGQIFRKVGQRKAEPNRPVMSRGSRTPDVTCDSSDGRVLEAGRPGRLPAVGFLRGPACASNSPACATSGRICWPTSWAERAPSHAGNRVLVSSSAMRRFCLLIGGRAAVWIWSEALRKTPSHDVTLVPSDESSTLPYTHATETHSHIPTPTPSRPHTQQKPSYKLLHHLHTKWDCGRREW